MSQCFLKIHERSNSRTREILSSVFSETQKINIYHWISWIHVFFCSSKHAKKKCSKHATLLKPPQSYVYLSGVFLKLIYLFWERGREEERGRETEHTSRGGAEREGERIPNRLCVVSAEPYEGFDLTNHEIMTWAEIKSQTLNQLSHPGAPRFCNFKHVMDFIKSTVGFVYVCVRREPQKLTFGYLYFRVVYNILVCQVWGVQGTCCFKK